MLKGYPLCSGVSILSALWSRNLDEAVSAVVCIMREHCFCFGVCRPVAVGSVLQCVAWSLWWMANLCCTVVYGLSPRASPWVGSTGRSQGLMGSFVSPRDAIAPCVAVWMLDQSPVHQDFPRQSVEDFPLILWVLPCSCGVSLIYGMLKLRRELTSTGALKYPSLAMWTRAN